ncbi:MAG: hypothetical protein HZA90_17335 [Verrucomicrobia bacterium]|nr:hypothetical protein [Verrucomicrobiota bacterium]
MTALLVVSSKFPLGQTVLTAHALEVLHPGDVAAALQRHARGDWGEVGPPDAAENEFALQEGFRLLSAYTDRHGVKFWIITEADRSYSTILLPEDY